MATKQFIYWTRYLPRVVDRELDELFTSAGGLGAVALEGPKAVGKTETALRRARTTFRLEDPGQVEILRGDPQRLVRGTRPVLVDEWQRFPSSWDLVRRAVDEERGGGQFLLTGSAAPLEQPMPRDGTLLGAPFESLAVLSVRVYAQYAGARVGHLRTRAGAHEVDVVVERPDGRILAIEVKLAQVPDSRDVRHPR